MGSGACVGVAAFSTKELCIACGEMASREVPAAIRAEGCLLRSAWLLPPRQDFEIPQVASAMQSLGAGYRGWPCATSADDRPLPSHHDAGDAGMPC